MFRRILLGCPPIFILMLACLSPLHSEEAGVHAPFSQLTSQPEAVEINSLWVSGKKSRAEKALNEWMKKDKASPWPWVQAAEMSFGEKKFNKALSLSKTALEKSPQCAEAYYWRGRSYEALNKPMEAANEYRAALIGHEQFEDAKAALDRVMAQLGS